MNSELELSDDLDETCPRCAHRRHLNATAGAVCGVQTITAESGVVTCMCSSLHERLQDVETDDPLRCKLRDGTAWRCHKYAGHPGRCSTHMDCGERSLEGGSICGFVPNHTGRHGWEGEPQSEPYDAQLQEFEDALWEWVPKDPARFCANTHLSHLRRSLNARLRRATPVSTSETVERPSSSLPSTDAVIAALGNTDYAKGHIVGHLNVLTEGERRTLFRAVLDVATPVSIPASGERPETEKGSLQEPQWETLKIRYDPDTEVFVGKHVERDVYSQGRSCEEAALAVINAVKLIDAVIQARTNLAAPPASKPRKEDGDGE